MGNQVPGLRQALKTVNALGKQMTREADADYSVALSAVRAGQANLSKQTRGLTRDLLVGQLKDTTSLSKLAKKARAQKKSVAAQKENVENRYGSALGQQIARDYSVATAKAKGTGKVIGGALEAGKETLGVAQTVAGLAKSGVAAQKAAATYSMNQALQQRAIVDSQTLAGLTGQLYQTALAYNTQWAMWKKQQEYVAKQAEKQQNEALKNAAEGLPSLVPPLVVDARTFVDSYKAENGDDLSGIDITAETTAWATAQGYDPAGTEAAVYAAILRNLKAGMPTGTATTAALDTLFGGMKSWDTLGPSIKQSVISGSQVAFAATRANEASAAVASGGGGVGTLDDYWAAGAQSNVFTSGSAPAGASGAEQAAWYLGQLTGFLW